MPDFLAICLSYVLVASLLGAALFLLARLGRHLGLDDWLAACFALVCIGCAGYLAFLTYWLSVPAGTILSLACPAGLIAFAARALWRRQAPPRELAQAMGLAAAFGFVYLSLLFCYVTTYSADVPAEVFFEWPRPHDQKIPLLFAEAIHDRLPSRVGKDIWGWRFSDRPPLQAGFVLLFSPIWSFVPRPIAYQALATTLQVGALAAAWLLLRALGFRYRETLLAVVAAGASGFVYYNAAYAWPKLLAATFVLVAIAPLARAFLARERLGALPAAIAAAAAALAMLAHGGAIYTLVPLALLLCIRLARLLDLRACAIGAAVIAALYGPWMVHTRSVDPSDSRLLKEHLTSGAHPSEPFWPALLRSYREVTGERWVQERLRNLEKHVADRDLDRLIAQVAYGLRDARLQAGTRLQSWPGVNVEKLRYDLLSLGTLLRIDQREILLRALGLMNIAWPLLLVLAWRARGHDPEERKGVPGEDRARDERPGLDSPLAFLLGLNVLTSVWWSVAQFTGGTTVIAHSSFAMVLICFVTAAVILARASERWAPVVCLAHVAWSAAVWVVLAPGAYWSEPRNSAAMAAAVLGAGALAALVRSWLRTARDPALPVA